MNYLLLLFGWVSYGVLHSLLASRACKEAIQRLSPRLARYYRLVYNLFAVVSLLLLLFFQSWMERVVLIQPTSVLRWVGAGIILFGLVILFLALRQYDLSEFSGLNILKPKTSKNSKLTTRGLSALVRHPLYTGTLFVLWGLWLYDATLSGLIMAFILSAYIRIGIYYEEKKLVREFGKEYQDYQKRVPMLLPTLFN